MLTRLDDLVERLGGQLLGDPAVMISGIAPLDAADATQISFLSNSRLRDKVAATQAAAVVLTEADSALVSGYTGARIIVKNPYAWFAHGATWFASQRAVRPPAGIHASAVVDPTASVDPSASIAALVCIEAGATVGADCVIGSGSFIGRHASVGQGTLFHARASLLDGCEIGARGIVHTGAVIGADGFGFANEGGTWVKIPQTGRVLIGDDVEIGANTTIDRGALADTVIEEGVKLDNQIQIAHNCHIGAHTAMAACAGIAGSTRIGRHCSIGGAAMIAGHLVIGDRVHVSSGSLVMHSIAESGQFTGFYPVTKHANWEKSAVLVRNLPAMREKIRELEKTVRSLSEQINQSE